MWGSPPEGRPPRTDVAHWDYSAAPRDVLPFYLERPMESLATFRELHWTGKWAPEGGLSIPLAVPERCTISNDPGEST